MRKTSGSERGFWLALGVTLSLAWGGPAAAQDDRAKNAARELAEQAARALAQGDAQTAQDLYARAYALVPAPTLSLRRARALTKLGRFVEAVEAYVRTTRTSLTAESPDAYREAVQQAYDELAKLRPRVAGLTLSVAGIDPKDPALHVVIDGKPLAPALIGVASPLDPGEHRIEAKTDDGRNASAKVTLAEGEKRRVQVELPAAQPGAAPTSAELHPTPNQESKSATSRRSSQRTFAYASLGVGAAGVAVGVIAGVIATSKHSSAKDSCPNGNCVDGSAGADDVDAFHRFRTISTVGYIVGALGVGAGVTLWLTSPKSPESAHIGAFAAPAAAGVRGTF